MQDVFTGLWKLNVQRSEFDPKYVPSSGTVVFEPDGEGGYLMSARGTNASGQTVAERPQQLIPDGREHAVPDIPGLTSITARPDVRTLVAEGRMGGKVVGSATYVVSVDGSTLVATASGTGVNGPFVTKAVFERE